jgi:hypothetical protein
VALLHKIPGRIDCAHADSFNDQATILWHTNRMPEAYDLTLLDLDGKLGRDIAIMRAEIEELHAKLARIPAVIARAALGIIFCTAAATTFLQLVASGALTKEVSNDRTPFSNGPDRSFFENPHKSRLRSSRPH